MNRIHISTIIRTAWDIVRYQTFCLFGNMPYPRRVLIALTYRCNSHCIMCNIWKIKNHHELTCKDWEKILHNPLFAHIEQVDVTGGEALLYPEFIQFATICIRSLPKLRTISVVTNGLAPKIVYRNVKNVAKYCFEHSIRFCISVSLDGIEKVHDSIRGTPNAFYSVEETFCYLKHIQKKFPIEISSGSLILHQNLHYVDIIARWFAKHNISFIYQLVGFHDTYVRNMEKVSSVGYVKNDLPLLLSFLKKLSKPKSWKDVRSYYWRDMFSLYAGHTKRTTPCPFLFDQFAIDAFGDVYYCFSDAKIGNWRDGRTLDDIYFDDKNITRRKRMWNSVCVSCNSGCSVERGIALDVKKYLWFLLTGRLWGRI